MNIHASRRNGVLVALLAIVSILACAPVMAKSSSEHVRGVITAVNGNSFTVRTDSGSRSIDLGSKTHIVGVVQSSLDNIKPGTFIGTANVKRGGHYRALEVVIFPPSMKGTGLGNYAWDLSAGGGASNGSSMTNGSVQSGHSMMTNGTVQNRQSSMTNGTVQSRQSSMTNGSVQSGHSMMTNGTVKNASHGGERMLEVNYGKGSKTIEVPNDVPVVAFRHATKSSIVKGAHVFVAGTPGQPLQAAMVAVGMHGTVPPM